MNTEQINALFEEWERPQGLTYKAGVTEVAKAFASYCLSKQGWKKFPENKPEKDGSCAVMIKGVVQHIGIRNWSTEYPEFQWGDNKVIAFMEIPQFTPDQNPPPPETIGETEL